MEFEYKQEQERCLKPTEQSELRPPVHHAVELDPWVSASPVGSAGRR